MVARTASGEIPRKQDRALTASPFSSQRTPHRRWASGSCPKAKAAGTHDTASAHGKGPGAPEHLSTIQFSSIEPPRPQLFQPTEPRQQIGPLPRTRRCSCAPTRCCAKRRSPILFKNCARNNCRWNSEMISEISGSKFIKIGPFSLGSLNAFPNTL